MFTLILLAANRGIAEPRGKILFTAEKREKGVVSYSLYAINLDGSNLKDLKVPVSLFTTITPSPSGSNMILLSHVQDENDAESPIALAASIVVLDLEGKEICKFPRISRTSAGGSVILDPLCSWLPDGKAISFARDGPIGYVNIIRAAIPSGEEKTVLSSTVYFRPFDPVWSPDGTKLSFVHTVLPDELVEERDKWYSTWHTIVFVETNRENQLYDVSDVRKGQHLPEPFKTVHRVSVDYLLVPRFLQWSVDSKRLAFYAPGFLLPLFPRKDEDTNIIKELDPPTLYVYDFPTGSLIQQSIEAEYITDAVLSPDGGRIAFATKDAVWLWDVGETDAVLLANIYEPLSKINVMPKYWGPIRSITWLNDGTNVVFSTGPQVFVLNVATKSSKEILLDTKLDIKKIAFVNTN